MVFGIMTTVKEKTKIEQIERDMIKLGTDVKVIHNKIHTIETNHLAHIQKDLDKMDMRLWAIMFMIVGLAVSNVLAAFFG